MSGPWSRWLQFTTGLAVANGQHEGPPQKSGSKESASDVAAALRQIGRSRRTETHRQVRPRFGSVL